jgi:non-heme chloroperoxidase
MKALPQLLLLATFLPMVVNAQEGQRASKQSGLSFVTVEPGVRLEVKDWGGVGKPVVLLAGLGGTLHVFDDFAPQLTGRYHVYGITRRGYGASTAPDPVGDHYDADRLGDDVISVLDQMNIQAPVLIGHSFAGEELSSVCSRFPKRVAGLVYLDAAYRYAFSPEHRGDFRIDTIELRRALNASLDAISPEDAMKAINRLQAMLPQFETDLGEQKKLLATVPAMSAKEYTKQKNDAATSAGQVEKAALDGERRYTTLPCPVLAIFALPHDHGLSPGTQRDASDALEMQTFGPLADSFETGVPNARVVRIAHAKHAVFESNPIEVADEINRFIGSLKNK